jgi:hypothetical protein
LRSFTGAATPKAVPMTVGAVAAASTVSPPRKQGYRM